MTKTVSLRIDGDLYNALKTHAQAENRSISNFIETATMKYIAEVEYVDDFEMESIIGDTDLVMRIRQGSRDAAKSRGRFV